ncbi:hypothetical protein JCM17961_36570 [Endothiovibrio diazotrophicus]
MVMNQTLVGDASPVQVVMATYNGGRFIGEQLESLRRQSYRDWVLWVRDDGSTDDTLEVVRRHGEEDSRIRLLDDRLGNQGPAGNFNALLAHAHARGARYVFLADQDDIWSHDKMERQLALLREREGDEGSTTIPRLMYSDLEVVDRDMKRIHRSFMRFEMLRHETNPLPVLLTQNFVTGCTMLVNRALLEVALPIPPRVMMHDWWLALCAAASGRLHHLPEQTVRYRQHGGNQVGAQGYWRRLIPFYILFGRRRGMRVGNFVRTVCQAQALLRRLDECGTAAGDARRSLVEAYCELFEVPMHGMVRARRVFALGIHRQGVPRQILLYVQAVMWARKSRQMKREGGARRLC